MINERLEARKLGNRQAALSGKKKKMHKSIKSRYKGENKVTIHIEGAGSKEVAKTLQVALQKAKRRLSICYTIRIWDFQE